MSRLPLSLYPLSFYPRITTDSVGLHPHLVFQTPGTKLYAVKRTTHHWPRAWHFVSGREKKKGSCLTTLPPKCVSWAPGGPCLVHLPLSVAKICKETSSPYCGHLCDSFFFQHGVSTTVILTAWVTFETQAPRLLPAAVEPLWALASVTQKKLPVGSDEQCGCARPPSAGSSESSRGWPLLSETPMEAPELSPLTAANRQRNCLGENEATALTGRRHPGLAPHHLEGGDGLWCSR